MEDLRLPEEPDYLAPDGSAIRQLQVSRQEGLRTAPFPQAGRRSRCGTQRSWRSGTCSTAAATSGMRAGATRFASMLGDASPSPRAPAFRFRATGSSRLEILIGTFPGMARGTGSSAGGRDLVTHLNVQ